MLAVLRGFIFCSWHGKSIDAPQVCVQICSNWGVDYPGPGISVGDRPGRMAKCMWGPSSFNSRPGWSGLWFFLSLGRGIKGLKGRGLQSSGTDRQMEGAPRAITVRAHRRDRLQQTTSQTDGWMVKLTDLATTNQQTTKSITSLEVEMLMNADAEVSSRHSHEHEHVHVKVHIFVASAHWS